MKKFIIILFSFFTLIFVSGCNKNQNYIFENGVYTTINGIEIPEEKFKELSSGYIDFEVKNMIQERFNELLGEMSREDFDEIIENTEIVDFKDDVYVNKKNVKITKQDFNNLRKYYKFNEINNMTQDDLDNAFNDIYCIKGYDESHNLIRVPIEECE